MQMVPNSFTYGGGNILLNLKGAYGPYASDGRVARACVESVGWTQPKIRWPREQITAYAVVNKWLGGLNRSILRYMISYLLPWSLSRIRTRRRRLRCRSIRRRSIRSFRTRRIVEMSNCSILLLRIDENYRMNWIKLIPVGLGCCVVGRTTVSS